ncbi:MAG: metallophosphoesterase family protein [Deltaproteobacteria bacterium]|nr:metallophosphoesterase family protein [Deltaproteobacteria bacterium]
MKIGVLSDTHLNHVTNELKEIYDRYLSDKDLILHAGDIVSIEVVDFFRRNNFHGVHGNMDPSDVQNALPEKRVIEIGPYRIGLIHGWGFSAGLEERIRSEFNEVDVIIYGHSHQAVSHEREGVLFFNPGTATGFSSEGLHSIGVLELGDSIQGQIIEV